MAIEVDLIPSWVGAAAGGIAAGAGMAGGALGALAGATGAVSSLVGAFNPASVELLNQIFEDMSAVIGRELMPIMDGLIQVWRSLADILAKIVPIFRPFIDAIAWLLKRIAEFMNLIGNAIGQVFGTAGASSVGASAKGAQGLGLEQYGRNLQIAAFGMASPEQRTAQATESIQKLLEDERGNMRPQQKRGNFPGQRA